MHSAPSVSFPVGRSRMARRLLWSIWGLGAATLVAWCVQYSGAPWRTALLAGAVALAARTVWRAPRLEESLRLQWNGLHWSCDDASRPCGANAAVHLDLQSLVLVRLHGAGRPALWLWLERSSCPERWLDLRRALYANVPRTAEPVLNQP